MVKLIERSRGWEEELTVKVFCSMFIPAGLKIPPQAVTICSNRNSIRDWGGLPNSQNKLERSHFRTTCKCFQNPSEIPWRQNGKLVHQRCDNIFNKSIFSEGNTKVSDRILFTLNYSCHWSSGHSRSILKFSYPSTYSSYIDVCTLKCTEN